MFRTIAQGIVQDVKHHERDNENRRAAFEIIGNNERWKATAADNDSDDY